MKFLVQLQKDLDPFAHQLANFETDRRNLKKVSFIKTICFFVHLFRTENHSQFRFTFSKLFLIAGNVLPVNTNLMVN